VERGPTHEAQPFEITREEQANFFDLSLDLLCIAGLDGRFKRVNPSWTRVLGWTAEEFLARPVLEFVHPDDQEATASGRRELGDGRALIGLVNRYVCKDGTYRWLEWRSISAVERGLVYAAARDVTERRAAEELQERTQRQLLVANRMASVGTLAAGVAHEVNNPLAYVILNLDAILEEVRTFEAPLAARVSDLEQMARDARDGAERVRLIVRGMLTFSRADEEQLRTVDVKSILELSVRMTNHLTRARARVVEVYGAVPPVVGDEARLGQVFINLLLNAAQAISEGQADSNEIHIVSATDESGAAFVEIRDSGPGIAPGNLGRVFDPFYPTKPIGGGTGLGLSISHNHVTAIGGEISVTSEVGRGTTFRVVLPAAPAPQSSPPQAA
jgi:PAS domain S-box-containing protein